MPMPHWWAEKINKRFFNPKALVNDKWEVITHVGRSSGKTHRTPLASWEVDGTRVFVIVYGSSSDWVQNILSSGRATLETGGQIEELGSPRLISGATTQSLLAGRDLSGLAKLPPRFLRIDEYLQMDILSRQPAAASR
jgi:deazaflavin-dependent oxidoreductase (nitroreductase family)